MFIKFCALGHQEVFGFVCFDIPGSCQNISVISIVSGSVHHLHDLKMTRWDRNS